MQVTHGRKESTRGPGFVRFYRQISTYFPLTQFCMSKSSENSRGKSDQTPAGFRSAFVLYPQNSSSKPESFQELLLCLYSINTVFQQTGRGGKSHIVDADTNQGSLFKYIYILCEIAKPHIVLGNLVSLTAA